MTEIKSFKRMTTSFKPVWKVFNNFTFIQGAYILNEKTVPTVLPIKGIAIQENKPDDMFDFAFKTPTSNDGSLTFLQKQAFISEMSEAIATGDFEIESYKNDPVGFSGRVSVGKEVLHEPFKLKGLNMVVLTLKDNLGGIIYLLFNQAPQHEWLLKLSDKLHKRELDRLAYLLKRHLVGQVWGFDLYSGSNKTDKCYLKSRTISTFANLSTIVKDELTFHFDIADLTIHPDVVNYICVELAAPDGNAREALTYLSFYLRGGTRISLLLRSIWGPYPRLHMGNQKVPNWVKFLKSEMAFPC